MSSVVPLSVLDLAPIAANSSAGQALRNSIDLARHAERWGYRRFWLAEHHNMPGIASAATAVVIGQVAAATSTIRVGAGGIMLPNHAPLVIAEQFGTLAALFPGRIDLGLGRAPGTDQLTAHALRRTLSGDVNDFPRDVVELMAYFEPLQEGRRVQAFPGAGEDVEVWMLGSSLFGAQLAAMLGLPYAFASHFAPQELDRAGPLYRERFEPSPRLAGPHLMLALNVVAAETDAEAEFLASSQKQSFAALRTGRPGRLPPPVEDVEAKLDPAALGMMRSMLSTMIVGSPETVKRGLADFIARHQPDELIITAQIYDHAARLRSFELAAKVYGEL